MYGPGLLSPTIIDSGTFRLIEGSASTILLDIEGTTVPMEFVHGTLFKYAEERVQDFINRRGNEEEVQQCLSSLESEMRRAVNAGLENEEDIGKASIAQYARKLMENDSKFSALKALQGLIWEEGYADSGLKSEVYPDVPVALKKWKSAGKEVYIYSSGSALGQKLLFSHTAYGDLTKLISDFFDTTVGMKRDAGSYVNIARQQKIEPARILFFSDVVEELGAAASAGMKVILVDRTAGFRERKTRYPVIHAFMQ